MADLEAILSTIDQLTPDELEAVYRHIAQRRQAGYWLVPGERLKEIMQIMQPVYAQTDQMDEEEINTMIDEALTEVRLERKKTHRRN